MATVEARITGVEQDASTGWYRITTDDERIRRLDTKVAEKAREALKLKDDGVLALIEFTEKQSTNVNPHTQRPYINRYYEQAGSIEPEQLPEIPVVTPTRAKTDPGEAWRICLAAGAKLAVQTAVATDQLAMQRVVADDERDQEGKLVQPDKVTFNDQLVMANAWAQFFFFAQPPEVEPNEADDIPF